MSEKNNQERTSLQSKVKVSVEASVSSSINVSETSLPTTTASGGEASASVKSDIDTSSASTSSTAAASGSVQSSGTEISATAKAEVKPDSSGLSKDDMWRVYELRIAARNYNYDNYNKWMNYFVLLIGAIFVAYTSNRVVGSSKSETIDPLRVILGILGYLFSVLWYLSNKGFYYWLKSYMSLVHKMEEEMYGANSDRLRKLAVYTVFSGKSSGNEQRSPLSSSNISSSKIAILMAYLVAVAWFVELARQCSCWEDLGVFVSYLSSIVAAFVVTWGLGLLGKCFLASDMSSLVDVADSNSPSN